MLPRWLYYFAFMLLPRGGHAITSCFHADVMRTYCIRFELAEHADIASLVCFIALRFFAAIFLLPACCRVAAALITKHYVDLPQYVVAVIPLLGRRTG